MYTLTYTLISSLSKNFCTGLLFHEFNWRQGMPLQLACIADDITGASDLALILASNGMSVSLVLGVPPDNIEIHSDAVVVALKIRTAPVETAVSQAEVSARRLLALGASQLYFKYCSTFDSTDQGNIGPVTEALLKMVEAEFTVVCPAFPAAGRIIKDGVLYVGGVPLAESSMRHHPLTPMTRSSLLELMNAQTRAGSSGLVDLNTVRSGSEAILNRFVALQDNGIRFAVTDAESDDDLLKIAAACEDMKLLTGASALATGLPNNFRNRGLVSRTTAHAEFPSDLPGHPVILAGSCSEATRGQVAFMARSHSSIVVDPQKLNENQDHVKQLCTKASESWRQGPVLIYSSANPQDVRDAQAKLGPEKSAELVEQALGTIATELAAKGASKFIVAGGETSGAVAKALGIKLLETGPKIDVGVPWMISNENHPKVLAFKSGNFGEEDFFIKAMAMLPRGNA
jgi:uncharacterized protein YgbK (DUF1537 family)